MSTGAGSAVASDRAGRTTRGGQDGRQGRTRARRQQPDSMKDSRILSSYAELYPGSGARPAPGRLEDVPGMHPYVFDTCQSGVVLRAVMFVQIIVMVASLFET